MRVSSSGLSLLVLPEMIDYDEVGVLGYWELIYLLSIFYLDLVVGALVGSPHRLMAQSLFPLQSLKKCIQADEAWSFISDLIYQ